MKKSSENVEKAVDKISEVWYYMQAVSEAAPNNESQRKKVQKRMKKVVDKKTEVWYYK